MEEKATAEPYPDERVTFMRPILVTRPPAKAPSRKAKERKRGGGHHEGSHEEMFSHVNWYDVFQSERSGVENET